VKAQLTQHVHLRANESWTDIFSHEHTLNVQDVIMSKEYPGVSQGAYKEGTDEPMELDLNEVRNKDTNKHFEDVFKNEDDQALSEFIQPSVTGKNIKITYSLQLIPDYSTCCACNTPFTDIPVFICPPKLPSYQQIQAPMDWSPKVFKSKLSIIPEPDEGKPQEGDYRTFDNQM
jgi:hypothetical protein